MKLSDVEALKKRIRLFSFFRRTFTDSPRYAIGVGYTDRRNEYRLAARFKNAKDLGWFEDNYRDWLKGADTDLRVIGEVNAEPAVVPPFAAPPAGAPPIGKLRIGMRVQHVDGQPGSLGFFATRFGVRGFVSCNHVIARTDEARSGQDIAGATRTDLIGRLGRFHRLHGFFRKADCAFAEVADDRWPDEPGRLDGDGPIDPRLPTLAEMRQQMKVRKIGAATDKTFGTIRSVLDEFEVVYRASPRFVVHFKHVVEIESEENFAAHEDSGALVYSEDNRPVGLLFRSQPRSPEDPNPTGTFLSYANPIGHVKNALSIEIAVR